MGAKLAVHELPVVRTVVIRGQGVAAACCASLLGRSGLSISTEGGVRPKLPAIMVSESTQKLIGDVLVRTDLFDGLPPIRKRVVSWGSNATPLELPHAAIVVSEQVLLDRIHPEPELRHREPDGETAWTILAARPLPEPAQEFHFGSRMATASMVRLKPGSEPDASWVESLQNGWLFLLPSGETGWLLGVGGPTESLLAESRLIAHQIAEVERIGGAFPCHPRIAEPLSGPGWLACGTAALGFDPLCGDGSGHAAREAILASAVVRAAIEGADPDALTAHYRARLLAGFARHLEVCREFYRSGGSSPWWDEQVHAAQVGLDWCRPRLESAGGFRYRLNGFSLEAV